MIRRLFFVCVLGLSVSLSYFAQAQVVASDGNAVITKQEFTAALQRTPDKLKRLAAQDLGERYALINALIIERKLAAEADKLDVDDEAYWELLFSLLDV